MAPELKDTPLSFPLALLPAHPPPPPTSASPAAFLTCFRETEGGLRDAQTKAQPTHNGTGCSHCPWVLRKRSWHSHTEGGRRCPCTLVLSHTGFAKKHHVYL